MDRLYAVKSSLRLKDPDLKRGSNPGSLDQQASAKPTGLPGAPLSVCLSLSLSLSLFGIRLDTDWNTV